MSSWNLVLKTKGTRVIHRAMQLALEPVSKPPLPLENAWSNSTRSIGNRRLQLVLVHLANLALTFGPMFVVGFELTKSLQFWFFLCGVVCLCVADLSRCRGAWELDRLPSFKLQKLACCATGLSVLLTWWIALATSSSVTTWVSLVGFSVMLIGTWLRREAILSLGGDFVSAVTPGDQLCTRGVFAWFRHPSEVGLLLCVLGGCLTLGSLTAAGFLLVVVTPLSVLRVRMEEAELRNRFGNEYAEYRPRLSRVFSASSR